MGPPSVGVAQGGRVVPPGPSPRRPLPVRPGHRRPLHLGLERLTGATYHPWADVVTIIGSLDELRDEPGDDRFLVEEALARAVAQLGATSG